MTTASLYESAFVILDSNGNGTAKVGPTGHGQVWHPQIVSVSTSTATKSPTCKLYAGHAATQQYFVDGTYTGEQNSTDAISGIDLWLGNYVFAVWTGGDAGAQGTVTVTGTKDV